MKSSTVIIYLFLLTSILFGAPCRVQAQQVKVNITGQVIEQTTQEPVEQATVRLLQPKDSSMIRGTVSANNGQFTLKGVRPGNYLLNISFVGFDPIYKTIRVTGKENPLKTGKLELSDASIRLAEAVVVGKAPEVSFRNDTIEYNADSYKLTEGSVLEDLLKKMPGVEVDSDGKITVNGKEITKIMVDGKEFFSNDPKVASKNLPAKMIDKLQVLDKKSDMAKMTGFDDGEEETVINLTVKPGMKQGWFGNAYAGYGSKDRYEGNAMINRFIGNDQITLMGGANNTNNMGFSDMASNMFSGMIGGRGRGMNAGSGITSSGNAGLNFSKEFAPKTILGGNLRYSHSSNEAKSKSNRQNILPGDSSSYDNSEVSNRTKNDNIGADFRFEWEPDTLTRLIFHPGFNLSHSLNDSYSDATTLGNDRDSVNTNRTVNHTESQGYDLNASVEFSRKLTPQGRTLSISLSGGNKNSDSDGSNRSDLRYFKEDDQSRDEIIDQRSRYENKSFNYRAYISWVEPIGQGNFLQATYSFSQNRQESLKNVYTQDENGQYNVLDTAYSQSYRNNFINQRASLSFRSQREKYNYTIGLNLDPSYSSSENFVGDTTLSRLSRKVINLSPMARFNYLFDKRTHLRIMYSGRTSQPSMTQLQPVTDITDPTNIVTGNPDLAPVYTNNMVINFQKFTPQKQRAFLIMLNLRYVINDIVSYSAYNAETGVKTTTYKNVNGNYSGNFRTMFNTPLKNKKFSINSTTMLSYNNNNGYINEQKNTSRNMNLSERAGIDYRSDLFDVGINGNFRYNQARNSLQKENNQNTYNYGVGGYTTIYLPWETKIESDINWSANAGYGEGFEQKEILWNASLSKSFLKNNQGTLRIKIYDILQQRSNISRSITASYIQDSEYNTLNSYFMVHFIYRFSIFKGGGGQQDARPMPPGERRGPRQRPMGPPPPRPI